MPPPLASSSLIDQLSDELTSGTRECAVCTEAISRGQPIWSCRSCYGVLHLRCIAFWADSQKQERERHLQSTSGVEEAQVRGKFRCPLCQALNETNTTATYTCFCGKSVNPRPDGMLVPGSCGEPCARRQADEKCPHRCTLLCHPGPCPLCSRTREQECFCGKHTKVVGCSSQIHGFECGETCGKLQDCGHHTCPASCHDGPCPVCTVLIQEACYCGATTRKRRCAVEPGFRCQQVCHKKRDCGMHECGAICHDGPCEPCLRLPERQKYCPCGKTLVKPGLRTSCTDPVPSCGLLCEMPLPCGHTCWYLCHDETPCAPCREMVTQPCRCGEKQVAFPCFCQYLPKEQWAAAAQEAFLSSECVPSDFPIVCTRVCRKLLSCGKHKCTETCCTSDHMCYAICVKKLSCGQHQCGQLCHKGPCPPCGNVSYERLYCRCRRTWVEPPVPCGTPLPRCTYPCIVPRPCGHAPNHPCHAEADCPQCVIPVEKLCASHKQPMPYHMACHIKNVSCGKVCGKPLTCCGTACTLTCHGGPCEHVCKKTYPTLADILKKK